VCLCVCVRACVCVCVCVCVISDAPRKTPCDGMNSKSNSLSHSPESLGQLTDDHLSARSSHAISWCNDDVLCVAQQLCSLWHVDNDRVWKHFFLRVGIARLLDLHSRTLE
jgi:hypothetical protein